MHFHINPQALAEYDKIAEPDKAVAAENQLLLTALVGFTPSRGGGPMR
jgi:hypothetical protein